MGLAFGKIVVETPKYEVLKSTNVYEIRKFVPSVVAEITYRPSQMKNNDKDGGFSVLAQYIGVFTKPNNTKVEKIAMTSPVLTSEKIAMTVPVLTKSESSSSGGGDEMVTMQFTLPSKYKRVEEVPKPVDERVVIREEGERKYGVVKFGGFASDDVVREKVEVLKQGLENDGFRIVGDYVLARYNPTWILSMFKTNEVMIPVE